jgi:small subunit ribosomal protein S13
MIYLLKKQVEGTRRVYSLLLEVFGLNAVRAKAICSSLGLSNTACVMDLMPYHLSKLDKFVFSFFFVDRRLKRFHAERLQGVFSDGSYKGQRQKQGLPSRGQRTHTNAQTAKKRSRKAFSVR